MSDYENVIEIENLTKQYDGFCLDNVSLKVPKGSIMGFVGQNGAGKSTTIRLLLGIARKNSGSIKVFGKDIYENETEIKQDISAVFDEIPYPECLNAMQIEKVLKPLYKKWDGEAYRNYLDRFSLPRKKKISQYSKGMKMKLQIAAALSHKAKLLVLDEATTGLDPVIRNEILDIFLEYLQDADNSIFLSSHITSDLEKIADSITFIDKGKILLSGYKDEILENHTIIKCSKENYELIDKDDYISARITDFGVEVMSSDKGNVMKKYPEFIFDQPKLDDIIVYYVNKEKKEWS